jgi:hypothetical protein
VSWQFDIIEQDGLRIAARGSPKPMRTRTHEEIFAGEDVAAVKRET